MTSSRFHIHRTSLSGNIKSLIIFLILQILDTVNIFIFEKMENIISINKYENIDMSDKKQLH